MRQTGLPDSEEVVHVRKMLEAFFDLKNSHHDHKNGGEWNIDIQGG